MGVDSKYAIRFYTLIILLLISGVQYVINSLINNKLTSHGIQENSKFFAEVNSDKIYF